LERGTAGEGVELTGLGGSRRHWMMRTAALADGISLIRFVDRSEARAAEQMRVDFVANASHELRTPLATLIGYTETLREQGDEIDQDTRERFLAVVHDEARRMQRVVEDLISLSRIEAEKFTAPTDAVALQPLIDQALESARRIAAERDSAPSRGGSSADCGGPQPGPSAARQSADERAALRRTGDAGHRHRGRGRTHGPLVGHRPGRGYRARACRPGD
jgi:signal transduction histidine kinase